MFGSGLRLGVGFVNPCQSWLGSRMGVFGHGLWCCPSFAGCFWCSWLGLGFGLLLGRVWFRARFACPPLFPVLVCGVGVRAGPGSRLCPALLGWVVGVCFLHFCFLLLLCGVGCSVSLSRALWSVPPSPFFRAGLLAFFFFAVCVCMFPCPFSRWAAVPRLVLPVLAGWSPCASFGGPVFGAFWVGGLAAFCVFGGRFGGCGLFLRPPHLLPLFFFLFRGGACLPSASPGLAHTLWLVCGLVGPSPLLAEVPVCYSPPLLAGFRCLWWWAFLATPG